MSTILAVDTETANVGGGICEVAYVAVCTTHLKITGYAHSLINPQQDFDAVCRAAHHIRPDEVANSPTLADWMGDNFPSDRLIAAHNAAFDKEHLGETTPEGKHAYLCTWRLAQHLYPDAPRFTNQILRYYLDLDVSDMPEEAGGIVHRALYDTWCTAKMVLRMLEDCAPLAKEGETPVQTLERLSNTPVVQVNFMFGNKHRGKTWEQVAREDRSYLYFMRDKCKDLDESTKHTLGIWLDKVAGGNV